MRCLGGSGTSSLLVQNPLAKLTQVYGDNFGDLDASDWVINVGVTLSALTGSLVLTLALSAGGVYRDVPVTAGKIYRVSCTANKVTSSFASLSVYSGASFSTLLGTATQSGGGVTTLTIDVIPTTSIIRVYTHCGGSILNTAIFDDITVYEIVP